MISSAFQGDSYLLPSVAAVVLGGTSLLGGRGWREDPAVLLVVDPGFGRLIALDCERIPKPTGLPHALVEEARARSTGAACEITLPGTRQVHLLDLLRLMDRRHGQDKR